MQAVLVALITTLLVGVSPGTVGATTRSPEGIVAIDYPTQDDSVPGAGVPSQAELEKAWDYARAHLPATGPTWSAQSMRRQLGPQSVSQADLAAAAASGKPDENWTVYVDDRLNPIRATWAPGQITTPAR